MCTEGDGLRGLANGDVLGRLRGGSVARVASLVGGNGAGARRDHADGGDDGVGDSAHPQGGGTIAHGKSGGGGSDRIEGETAAAAVGLAALCTEGDGLRGRRDS